jgi:hypothetical protein
MPQVGSDPTIPVFEQAKTVHALECASPVIGIKVHWLLYLPPALTLLKTCIYMFHI